MRRVSAVCFLRSETQSASADDVIYSYMTSSATRYTQVKTKDPSVVSKTNLGYMYPCSCWGLPFYSPYFDSDNAVEFLLSEETPAELKAAG